MCPCKKIFPYKCAFIDFAVVNVVLLNTIKKHISRNKEA